MEFKLKPIGIIHTPYKSMVEARYQGKIAKDVCLIEVYKEYEDGLKDVEDCSHLILLYWLHKARRDTLLAQPPHNHKIHGVFATRSPHRPNPIGFCIVELLERKKNILKVKGLDAIDGTPLLDIKPYSPKFDYVPNAKVEWLEKAEKKC